jgi:archaea-specific DNA-binding protein|tara:strand:- start:1444 stop:1743 length:300 start_codon:yes stop_codon:yes gene_type:complete
MLMEEINEPTGQEQTIINIGNDPVMLTAVDVLSKLMIKNQIILKARGQSIPNAVAVANIITEKMLKDNSKIEIINLDTVAEAGIGNMISTVEIIIKKNQ